MFTEILNKKLDAHLGNGWNYGIQFGKEKARLYRYHTNGYINNDYEYKKWIPIEEMENLIGEDGFDHIDYLDQESYSNMKYVREASDILERLFHTSF